MKVRGLICCEASVLGFLDGRKSQTRRIISDAPEQATKLRISRIGHLESFVGDMMDMPETDDDAWVPVIHRLGCETPVRPRYQVGDVLYVREALKPYAEWDTSTGYHYHDLVYAARSDNDSAVAVTPERLEWAFDYGGHWQRGSTGVERRWVLIPSIHMPKWAARIWLEVAGVRVERVQEISGRDAVAEGVVLASVANLERWDKIAGGKPIASTGYENAALVHYRKLWDKLHGPGAWERNDWVFVYNTEPCEKPEEG